MTFRAFASHREPLEQVVVSTITRGRSKRSTSHGGKRSVSGSAGTSTIGAVAIPLRAGYDVATPMSDTAPRDVDPLDPVNRCTVATLPPELRLKAAQHAMQVNPRNGPPDLSSFDGKVPEFIVLNTTRYWGSNGVRLGVGFLEDQSAEFKSRVLLHMNAWNQHANVYFFAAAANATIRITCLGTVRASHVGTENVWVTTGPTMWLGGLTMGTPDPEFSSTVRHEAGHALGFVHEHQRDEIVSRIDPERAISYFWTNYKEPRQVVIDNVLTPLPMGQIAKAGAPDETSIMCYRLPAEIMKDGVAVPGGLDIDGWDTSFAGMLYELGNSKSAPAVLGVPDDPSYGIYADRLWIAFAETRTANLVQVASTADLRAWTFEAYTPEDTHYPPTLAAHNGRLWVGLINNMTSTDAAVRIFSRGADRAWTFTSTIDGGTPWSSLASAALTEFRQGVYAGMIGHNGYRRVILGDVDSGARTNRDDWSNVAPSIVEWNGQLWAAICAKVDSNWSIKVGASPDGVTWPTFQLIDVTHFYFTETTLSPSLAVFAQKLWVAYTMPDGRVSLRSSADGTTWSNAITIYVSQSQSANLVAPSLTTFNDHLVLASREDNPTGGDHIILYVSKDGLYWHEVPIGISTPPGG